MRGGCFSVLLLGVSGMPYKNYRVNCQLCGAEQLQRNLDRHMFRVHQVGEWRLGYSAVPSRSTTNAHSPERVMQDPEHSTCRLPVSNVTVVPISVHQSVDEESGSSMVNCHLRVPTTSQSTINVKQVPVVSVLGAESNNSCQMQSLMSDQRTVVSRPQMVSGVRVADNSDENCQSSLIKSDVNVDALQSGDTLNWAVRNAVLCMLRREDNNNLVALRRYLLTRFPEIPDVCRDVVIIATFTTAQKVALSYLDTLHDDATEMNIWARNYLHRWSHGLSALEPPPRYVPTARASTETPNLDRYLPVTNFLMTKELPVSMASQKLEFDKEFDRVTE